MTSGLQPASNNVITRTGLNVHTNRIVHVRESLGGIFVFQEARSVFLLTIPAGCPIGGRMYRGVQGATFQDARAPGAVACHVQHLHYLRRCSCAAAQRLRIAFAAIRRTSLRLAVSLS